MSSRCVLVLPYFGEFKTYFPLFLRSCRENPAYNWLIITDQELPSASLSDNIRVIHKTFTEFRQLIQSKFDFTISLDTPYKLCDFKPAYGYILDDLLSEFEYWGHCDCDLLFGRMAPILEPIFSVGFDKIFAAGHLTIYKNTLENNRRFMMPCRDGVVMYRIAFHHPEVFAFDEMFWARNVHTLFLEQGAHVFSTDLSFNVSVDSWEVRRKWFDQDDLRWKNSKTATSMLTWDNGSILSLDANDGRQREWLYLHLQGREMMFPAGTLDAKSISIGPDYFCPYTREMDTDVLGCIMGGVESFRRTYRRVRDTFLRKDPLRRDPYAQYLN